VCINKQNHTHFKKYRFEGRIKVGTTFKEEFCALGVGIFRNSLVTALPVHQTPQIHKFTIASTLVQTILLRTMSDMPKLLRYKDQL